MKKVKIININNIPLEGTHDLPNSRQTLVTPEDIDNNNLQAMTKGILEKDKVWDWHNHETHDELCVVISGTGTFEVKNENISNYKAGDVIIIPHSITHRIEAKSNSEFYFVRILN